MSDDRRPRVNRPPSRYPQAERPPSPPPRRMVDAPPARPAPPAPPPPPVRVQGRTFSFEVPVEQVRRDVVREHVPHETAQRTPPRAATPPPEPARRGASNRDVLRRALATPGAARQAFLLREVLGPPVSLRRDSGDLPG